jgi:hypothetical protein
VQLTTAQAEFGLPSPGTCKDMEDKVHSQHPTCLHTSHRIFVQRPLPTQSLVAPPSSDVVKYHVAA